MSGRRAAPQGKYFVLGVDTFEGSDYGIGTFDTLDEAKKTADEKGGVMNRVYVYDDQARCVHSAGSY